MSDESNTTSLFFQAAEICACYVWSTVDAGAQTKKAAKVFCIRSRGQERDFSLECRNLNGFLFVDAPASTESIVPECMIYRKHFVALLQN